MQMRKIGSLEVSVGGVGCGNFGMFLDEAETRAIVDAAVDGGITHFDTADVYGSGLSEEFLGRALGARRSRVVITTKFGSSAPENTRPGGAEWVKRACEASLERLKTDWIDLYLIHRPDPATPIAETLGALRDLQSAGKVREIGCSNVTPEQLDEAACVAAERGMEGFRTVQNSYSLLDRTPEATLIPTMDRLGLPMVPYLPLASGMLTGKYRRDQGQPETGRLARSFHGTPLRDFFPGLLTEQCFDVVDGLAEYARGHGHTLVELALGWLASKPYVASVIAGASSPAQLRSNVDALFAWRLTEAQHADVARLTRVDVAYSWNAGFPAYAQLPSGVTGGAVPDIRRPRG